MKVHLIWFLLCCVLATSAYVTGFRSGSSIIEPLSLELIPKFRLGQRTPENPWGVIEKVECYRNENGKQYRHGPSIEWGTLGDSVTTTWYNRGKWIGTKSTSMFGDPASAFESPKSQ